MVQQFDNMKFAVRIPQGGPAGLLSAGDIRRVAELVDATGFWGVTVCDMWPSWDINEWRHYPNVGVSRQRDSPDHKYADLYDPLAMLSYIAAITENVMLVPCIIVLPKYHPVYLAKWAASVDQLSKGRLIMGVGIGGPGATLNKKYLALTNPNGPNMDEPKIRGEMTDEYIQAMIKLWTDDTASFHGKFCNFNNVESHPQCYQRPHVPIWIGALVGKSRGLRRTAELGEAIVPNMATPDDVRRLHARIRELSVKAGRSNVDFKVFNETWVCLGNTTEEAWGRADRKLIEGTMASHVGVEANTSRVLIGSRSDIVKTIEAFAEAGCYGFELRMIYPTVDNLIEQIKEFAEIQKSFSQS